MSAATSTNENCMARTDVILSVVNPGPCTDPAESVLVSRGYRTENAFSSTWPTRCVADALWMRGVLKIHIDPLR